MNNRHRGHLSVGSLRKLIFFSLLSKYNQNLRCPTRKQNIDYTNYVLTALYHESNKVEPWEGGFAEEVLAIKEREKREREDSDLISTGCTVGLEEAVEEEEER